MLISTPIHHHRVLKFSGLNEHIFINLDIYHHDIYIYIDNLNRLRVTNNLFNV